MQVGHPITSAIEYELKFNFSAYHFADDVTKRTVIVENTEHIAKITCPEKSTVKCNMRRMAVMIPIFYNNYLFNITLQDKQGASQYFSDSGFSVIMINGKYTVFMAVLRYLAFFISVIVLITFYSRLTLIKRWSELTVETKFVLLLACLALLYNDPFFAITILVPNRASVFFTAFFTTNTIVALIFFWLIMYQVWTLII